MNYSSVSRLVVALAAVIFAAVAVTIWAVPEEVALRVGLEVTGTRGSTVLRSDLAGLFGGLALLCAGASWTARRSWSLGAACVMGAIVAGRLVGWVSQGRPGADGPELVLEVLVLGALLVLARDATSRDVPVVRRSRWPVRVVVALAAASLAGAAVLSRPDVQLRLFTRGAEEQGSLVNRAPLADDALRVAVCGSSAPLPSARRAKACVAVFAGGKFYIVDVGPESVENLVLWGIPLSDIGAVLLTHMHSDHIGDLGELNLQTWAAGRPGPLVVYGGPGVASVVEGFNTAYRLDQGYRTAHHGARVMPPATWALVPSFIDFAAPATPARDRATIVFQDDALRVTAIEVDHAPIEPAYAYRFDYKGRSVLVSGDLKFHPQLVEAARGVDLLVSEAIATHMTRALGRGAAAAGRNSAAAILHDIEDYHMTPDQAARVANEAGVRLLAFYHLLPAPDGWLTRRVFAQGVDEIRRGDWTIADDGSLYTMPVGSDRVAIGQVVE